MNQRRKPFSFVRNIFVFAVSGLVLLMVIVAGVLLSMPDVRQLETCFTTSMFQVQLCPEGKNYVRLNGISPYVVHAVIAAEDGSFYQHKGFDWFELKQSFQANLKAGGFRRGGSTITQQLAKNAFLTQDKSLWRKVREAYLAYAIENRYKKDFILEKYLNVVEFGPGLFGVKAAANHYFHKSPASLHPLEAAYLAFLLPNPKSYSKSHRRGELTPFARRMVQIILQRMRSFGKLSPAALDTATASIGDFPWSHLGIDSFQGSPGYGLDATYSSEGVPPVDEEALERLMHEDDELSSAPGSRAVSRPSNEEGAGDMGEEPQGPAAEDSPAAEEPGESLGREPESSDLQ